MHNMSLHKAFEILASRSWLADVAPKDRDLLKAIASVRCSPAEKRIFEIDGEPQGMIGVVSGSVRLAMKRPSGDEYVLFRPGAGFWVGHYAVLANSPHLLSCTAAETTVFVWLPKQPLVRLLEENPVMFNEFSKLTYRHMRNVLDLIARITLKDSVKRVASRLLAEDSGRRSADGWIKLPQPELAEMLSMSLPTLQRAMGKLAAEDLVEVGYGRVRLLDRKALKEFSTAPN
jgi:CRP-like cAMP-binding protein